MSSLHPWLAAGTLAAALAAAPASAAGVSYYSARQLNSNEYVQTAEYANSNYGYIVDYSGAATEGSASGTRTWAFGNGLGGYLSKSETSSVFARADLSTGELKAMASLALGANEGGIAPDPGQRFTTARATAILADSLSFRQGESSYLWAEGQQFNFSFSVDGVTSIPAGTPTPLNGNGMSWATLRLDLWRPGGLDANVQLSNFDYTAYAQQYGSAAAEAEWNRLANAVDSFYIGATAWCLGDNSTSAGYCGGVFYQQVALADGSATVNYSFAPGGDFEWTLELSTRVALDISAENTSVTLDFSHTVHTGFTAPADATTYSASGLLPNTLPLAAVPEPASWAMALAGLMAVGWRARRRARG